MLLVEQENLNFSELVPNFFGQWPKKKKECSNYCLNRNQIKIQILLLFHSFPSCSTCTHPPLTVQKPKSLHTTVVYLADAIFVLLKIPSRAHEIISRAHEMIYRELSFQRQIHVS